MPSYRSVDYNVVMKVGTQEEPPIHFRDCVFQVLPAESHTAHDKYRKALDRHGLVNFNPQHSTGEASRKPFHSQLVSLHVEFVFFTQ